MDDDRFDVCRTQLVESIEPSDQPTAGVDVDVPGFGQRLGRRTGIDVLVDVQTGERTDGVAGQPVQARETASDRAVGASRRSRWYG